MAFASMPGGTSGFTGIRTVIFVDGENVLSRYESMKKDGWTPSGDVVHSPRRYLWTPRLANRFKDSITRVNYYTAAVGCDETLEQLKVDISSQWFNIKESTSSVPASLVPRVFKKAQNCNKTKSVDINLSTDMLRGAYMNGFDRAVILSGDGDYLPVIEDVMRTGKQVYIGAFTSGLNKGLIHAGDYFLNLDTMFFELLDTKAG